MKRKAYNGIASSLKNLRGSRKKTDAVFTGKVARGNASGG